MNDKQRGFKSYGELTLNEVLKMVEQVMGEWDGDNSGLKEDRANAATELSQSLSKVIDLVVELEEDL
jgi:hypothetical protein